MKYIKLFESFDKPVNSGTDLIFDWLPFDNEINNSMNSSIPSEIGMNDLMEYCKNHPEIHSIGLYIAHHKNNSGFSRYITSSISPLLLDHALFDSDFQKISEHKNIDPYKTSIGDFSKGANLLGRMGLFGEKSGE